MDEKEQKTFRALFELLKVVNRSATMSVQGIISTQNIIVDALLKSGALDRQILTGEINAAIQCLTKEQRASEFSHALTQLGGMLGLKVESLPTGDDAAWEETRLLIERLQRG